MKWGVQQVRVTLESDSGETLVVEQNPDGSVVCEPVQKATKPTKPAAKPEPASKKPSTAKAAKPPTKPKPDKPPTKAPKPEKSEKPEKPEKSEKSEKSERPAKTAKPTKPATDKPADKPESAAKKPHAAPRAGAPLDWQPIADHGYTGIAAAARWGVYKALRAKTTATYALFFETANQPPHHIGCFRTLDDVKARAQQIHDAGWPPHHGISAADVEGACPAPTAEPAPAEPAPAEPEPKPTAPKRGRKPKSAQAEPAPATSPEPTPPPSTAPAPTAAEADMDNELINSFAAALAANTPDEEDD